MLETIGAATRRDVPAGSTALCATPALGGSGPISSDFAFQTGRWTVRHRKLKHRLVGDTEWLSFRGRCEAWEIMGGAGNIEDNVLDDPTGAYRAAALRHHDVKTGLWSIWWLDGRSPDLDTPMQGQFWDGVGTFFGKAELAGAPIDVRFLWSDIGANHARWEQAFARPAGEWEVNWVMDFTRSG